MHLVLLKCDHQQPFQVDFVGVFEKQGSEKGHLLKPKIYKTIYINIYYINWARLTSTCCWVTKALGMNEAWVQLHILVHMPPRTQFSESFCLASLHRACWCGGSSLGWAGHGRMDVLHERHNTFQWRPIRMFRVGTGASTSKL